MTQTSSHHPSALRRRPDGNPPTHGVSFHPVQRMNARAAEILDHLTSLADPTRCRTLLLLDGHELPVSELCSIMQLPQSTVSRHLKALADGGWVTAHSEGPSRLYTMP